MKLATRINSYLRIEGYDLEKSFSDFKKVGLGYVDLNYPEHVKGYDANTMKSLLNKYDLKLNGVALRFRNKFINGELGNSDPELAKDALQLCKDAADYCRAVGGKVVTIWLGFDGFDYSFQINYKRVWDQLVHAFQEVCDYAPDLQISIEYKPYEERSYAFIDSMYKDKKPFIILDDPFVNMDTFSINNAHRLIEKLAKQYQILYFTCHNSSTMK